MLTGKKGEMVRAFGNSDDKFKCQIYEMVYIKHETDLLDSEAYGQLPDAEKVNWADSLVQEGFNAAAELHDAERERIRMEKRMGGIKIEGGEEPPKFLVQHYKADVATKIAKLGDDDVTDADKIKCLGSCRDLVVSAHICAIRLQSIMRGHEDRKAAAKKKKGKKKGKKK